MSEPGWNPTSESFPDHLEGSAYLADEAAGGPRIPTVDYGQEAVSTAVTPHGQGGCSCPPRLSPFARGGRCRVATPYPPFAGGRGGWSGQDEPADSCRGRAARARQLLSLLSTVAHGAAVATWQGIVLARRFPRASLASGLSIAILAAVMVLKPGKGEHDTTVQIENNRPRKRPSTSRRLRNLKVILIPRNPPRQPLGPGGCR